MPLRKIAFVNNHTYHIYNRGVEKRVIFTEDRNFLHFIELMRFYAKSPRPKFSLLTKEERQKIIKNGKGKELVKIHCYCLIPNHFHFLLTQCTENGIHDFMALLSNSYSRYFNILNNRVGPLFQGNFKAVLVETDEQLLHTSRYIHLNPCSSGLVEKIKDYRWSSYKEFISDIKKEELCSKKIILDQFVNKKEYKKFVNDYKDYARTLETIKDIIKKQD